MSKIKEIVEVSSLRLWFYRKKSNNQLYAMAVSDVSLRGIDSVLYKGVSLHSSQREKQNHPFLGLDEPI